jgi:hypothetical protein
MDHVLIQFAESFMHLYEYVMNLIEDITVSWLFYLRRLVDANGLMRGEKRVLWVFRMRLQVILQVLSSIKDIV